jgi:RNA polymerase-associated protein LEO1
MGDSADGGDLDDLFGSDNDEEQQQQVPAQPQQPADGSEEEENLEDDLPDVQQPVVEDDERELFGDDEGGTDKGPPIDVAAPLLSRPRKNQAYLLKLTNVLGVEARPFDRNTYQPEEIHYYDNSGFKRVKKRDTNVIRWRYAVGPDGAVVTGPDGQPIRESNARLIRWSDGSESLQLGDEMLDVARQDISHDHAYLYAVRYDIIQVRSGPMVCVFQIACHVQPGGLGT